MMMRLQKQKLEKGYEEILEKLAKFFWCKPLVIINGFKMLYTETISIVEWFPDLLSKIVLVVC
jgi:hypothetical protein